MNFDSSSVPVSSTPQQLPTRKPAIRRLLRAMQWTVNLLVLTVACYLFTPLSDRLGRTLTHLDEPRQADVIVVLGALPERAVEAARLYRDGYAPRVIVSGAAENAKLLKKIVEAHGVPSEAIIVDDAPMRTLDHPRTVAQAGGLDKSTVRLLVVTSSVHTSRARACFLSQGYANVRMCSPQWLRGGKLDLPRDTWFSSRHEAESNLYELLAWGYYKIRGWL